MASILDLVKHYQHAIEKYPNDEQKILKSIDKLFNLGVTVQHLQETGVGRTVNALRKEPGDVGKAARALVYKWKLMVAAEESDHDEDHNQSTTYNGHENGKTPEDSDYESKHKHNQYEKNSRIEEEESYSNPKYMNGDYSGGKRKHGSSEEEEPYSKKSRHMTTQNELAERIVKVKKEQSETEHDSASSQSDEEGDSDSRNSESCEETKSSRQKLKTEYKRSVSPKQSVSQEKYKRDSSSSGKSQKQSEKHSKHSHSESRHITEKSSKDHKSSSSDKHTKEKDKTQKRECSDHTSDKEKKKKENKEDSSSRHKSSSEKHKSSSNSDKSKTHSEKSSKPEKHSSSSHKDKNEKEKHKHQSEKSSDKHKSKEKEHTGSSSSSSKDKHHTSSKERTKEKDSSSKDKENSHKSDKKHSSSSDTSAKENLSRSKSDKTDDRKRSSDGKEKDSYSKSSHSSKSSKSSSSKSKDIPKKKKDKGIVEDGIDCGSGASFAEALGMISPSKPKKKSAPIKENHFSLNSSGSNDELMPASLLSPNVQLAPLPTLEISALPEISPNYKPRPPPKFLPHFNDEDAISAGISSKNQRTKVYSGNKVLGKIPTLYEMCVQILQDHIDALEYTGGVPYEILKPIVDKATPQQLYMLEHYNPYLIEDTNDLWRNFCVKSFRTKMRHEMESWKEMYIRCQEEQENRLKSLTANIKIAQEAKKAPIKQTKMAYVDTIVKPPRSIARKQAQHGTAFAATASPAARVAALAAAPNVLKGGARPAPVITAPSAAFQKPKKAPLMQKALQFMRGRKR